MHTRLESRFGVSVAEKPQSTIENLKFTAIFAIALTFVFAGVDAQAQPAKKVFRIGYLSSSYAANDSTLAGIVQALRDLGYMEGQHIAFEKRYAGGMRDRRSELAAELVQLKVDIILVDGGTPWIRATMNASKTIPIVMTGQGIDPVVGGLIKSLARPGGNVTGVTSLTTELGGKRLELLKEVVPKATRVAVLYDGATPGRTREVKQELPVAARALKLTIQPWELRTADDLDKVFAAMSKQRPDGLYVTTAGELMRSNFKRILDFALTNRLPSMTSSSEAVEAGWLMSYGADAADSDRRVAYFVDRILKGAKPADLPVEQPTKFDFVVNLKTAKQIGVVIPPDLLTRATRVIR